MDGTMSKRAFVDRIRMTMNLAHEAVRSAVFLIVTSVAACTSAARQSFVAPGEFEPQEYIWLTWVERGWLGGPPASDVTLEVLRAITPYVKVRLVYSSLTPEDPSMRGPHRLSQADAEARLRARLSASASRCLEQSSVHWSCSWRMPCSPIDGRSG